MKLIKRLFTSLIVFFVVMVLISFLLPQKQHVERTAEMSASAAKIYPHLADPKLFGKWSPWSQLDPNMKVEYSGPKSGKGAGMSWQSEQKNVGSGSWVITDAVENQSLNVDMDFGDQGGATSFFKLKENGGKTNVTWGFDTDAGMNPMMRWFGLLMDKMVGSEYQKGLETLKVMVEK